MSTTESTTESTPESTPEEPKLIQHGGLLRSLRMAVHITVKAGGWRALLSMALTATGALTGVVATVWVKFLIDAVVRGDRGDALVAAGLVGGIAVLFSLSAGVAGVLLRLGLEERVSMWVDARLIELTAQIPGLEHHERSEYVDEMELLRAYRGSLGNSAGAIIENIAVVVRLLTTLGVLAALHPLLLLLPVFGLPMLATTAVTQRRYRCTEEQTAPNVRLAHHLYGLGTAAESGKELRVFGLGREVTRRYRREWDTVDGAFMHTGVRNGLLETGSWVVFSLGYIAAIALMTNEAIHGRATVGDVVLTLSLAAQVNDAVSSAASMMTWMLQTLRSIGRYLWLVDYADERPTAPGEVTAPPPDRLTEGIRFTRVSFRYPGTDVDVLRDADLHLPAGSTVAIVGDNGAGKSTIVKLLCRFYEPTSGTVTLDGIDLRDVDFGEWRRRLAAGFQDYARFELVARENVGVGDLGRLDDPDALASALDRASANDVIATLPDGLDTQLGMSFDDGRQLSGGQWQKLSLGRAMMRDTPLLLVLDEPTAALDAETEHALFERYAGAARRAAVTNGAITVLVSHRFSTVRMADLIVVVDAGGIREVGSHQELMARAGLYAELYDLQAKQYR